MSASDRDRDVSRGEKTHSSMNSSFRRRTFSQTGQAHVGVCSLIWNQLEASKHWMWLHWVDLMGLAIRMYDS